MPNPSMASLFLELAKPNKDGFSRKVYVREFVGKYKRLQLGNGGSWCRDDGSLARRFNIQRAKKGNAIHFIMLHGFKKSPIKKPIPAKIHKTVSKKKCAVLAIGSRIEVDHKDGRRDDPRLADPNKVTPSDFQPLSRAANVAKRQHCKVCRETGKRFDARQLGYSKAQVEGNGDYRGTCVGCYWYDPYAFNKKISRLSKSGKGGAG